MKKRFCKDCGKPLKEGKCTCAKTAKGKAGTASLDLAVSGMVCHSCDSLVKRSINKLDGVCECNADYKKGKASVSFDPKKVCEEDIISAIKGAGYKAQVADEAYRKKQLVKNIAAIGALAAIVTIVLSVSNSIGVDPKVLSNASLGVVFVFGLLTGFHCLGMCGGFVISYSTRLGKGYNPLPHLAYNIGRVITYTALGFVVGFLGSLVKMSYHTQGQLIIMAGAVMILLGLNLLGILTVFRGAGAGVSNPLRKLVACGTKGSRGPFILGLLNGLVPCGMVYIVLFTYVPFTGSAISGAIAMAVFGLGTVPLMFLYGSAISRLASVLSKNFVRYSGVIVLVLALVMINRGAVLTNIPDMPAGNLTNVTVIPDVTYQEITMTIRGNEFVPNKFTVEAGKPVKWTIIGESVTGCSNEVIAPDFGVDVKVDTGETKTVIFTPTEKGRFQFSCWMVMILGEIEVV